MGVMTRKSYGQFCGLAHALDVVGERWTLLLVRELVSGPKRYTQLAEALSGIGTSLLAARVRQLEADGVIQRRLALDQPGSTVVYELSDAGRELAAAVVPWPCGEPATRWRTQTPRTNCCAPSGC